MHGLVLGRDDGGFLPLFLDISTRRLHRIGNYNYPSLYLSFIFYPSDIVHIPG